MQTRSLLLHGLAVLFLCLAAVPVARGGEQYVIDASATESGNTYKSLESLRLAIDAGLVYIYEGDVVILKNDDYTLTDEFPGHGIANLDIRSEFGNRYAVGMGKYSNETALVNLDGNRPTAKVDTLTINNTSSPGSSRSIGLEITNTGAAGRGTVDISDSVFHGDAYAGLVVSGGPTDITVTNSYFTGNSHNIVVNANAGASTNVNVIFDHEADDYTHWDGTFTFGNSGTGSVTANFDIAENKTLHIRNGLSGDIYTSTLNKTGLGVLKVSNGGIVDRFDIQEGTMAFTGDSYVNNWSANNLNVGSRGTLKVWVTPGNLSEHMQDYENVAWKDTQKSFFTLNSSITTQEGARLEIGGISLFPQFKYEEETTKTEWRVGFKMISTDVWSSNIASTMTIDNKLLKAHFQEGDLTGADWDSVLTDDETTWNGYVLVIDEVNNLGLLNGIGSYADDYRFSKNLSEAERDMLDSIYCSGGATSAATSYLQTIGGAIVQNSLLAVRHNQANLVGKINRRLTAYHKNELALPDESDSRDINYYNECITIPNYGEMYAWLDQSWMHQKDSGNLAGYRFSNTTLGIGYDYHMDEWIYGGALSYSTGDMKLRSNNSTRTDADNLMAAIYASWAQEGMYISGTAFGGYGWNDSRSTYNLPGTALSSRTGNYGTSNLGVNLEIGYMMETEFYGVPMRVTPYGGLTYSRMHRQAVNDTGAYTADVDLRKRFRASNWNSWEGSLGARISAPIEKDGYTLIPSLDVAWTRTSGSTKSSSGTVYMMRDPSSTWYVPIMSSNRSALRVAAGVDARIRENMVVGANYEYEWRNRFSGHQFNLNVAMDF